MPPKARVLVVDDSAIMRLIVQRIIDATPDLEVVAQAGDGHSALLKIEEFDPDVVTLDVQMPGLSGLDVLQHIMRLSPRPVIMLSYVTQEGAAETARALALGAVDAVAKPSGPISLDMAGVADELVRKIRTATQAEVHVARVARGGPQRVAPKLGPAAVAARLVIIGASTGGPQALEVLVPELDPVPGVAYLLVQHMAAWMGPFLVERMARCNASLGVRLALEGDVLLEGSLLIAPGDYHLQLDTPGRRVRLDQSPKVHGVRPSIDVALCSAVLAFGSRLVVTILTGMGEDGADGSAAVRQSGGVVLAQDQASSMIWGMPRAVAQRGLANRVVPLSELGAAIRGSLSAR